MKQGSELGWKQNTWVKHHIHNSWIRKKIALKSANAMWTHIIIMELISSVLSCLIVKYHSFLWIIINTCNMPLLKTSLFYTIKKSYKHRHKQLCYKWLSYRWDVHLPSTLRSTVSFSTSTIPNLIRMPYSSSSPGVTFNRTKEATDFDKFPVHLMRSL